MGLAVMSNERRRWTPVENEWRVSVAGRIGGIFAAAILAGAGVMLPVSISEDGLSLQLVDFVVASGIVALGIPILIAAFKPRISVTPTAVVIVNPLRRTRVKLDDIANVEPGWGGIAISTIDGATIMAWAVQRSNVSLWLHRKTRADAVAAAIRAAVDKH